MTDPTWNQTFIYCPVKETDLRERLLEITVWDYDRIGASEFLGEVQKKSFLVFMCSFRKNMLILNKNMQNLHYR